MRTSWSPTNRWSSTTRHPTRDEGPRALTVMTLPCPPGRIPTPGVDPPRLVSGHTVDQPFPVHDRVGLVSCGDSPPVLRSPVRDESWFSNQGPTHCLLVLSDTPPHRKDSSADRRSDSAVPPGVTIVLTPERTQERSGLGPVYGVLEESERGEEEREGAREVEEEVQPEADVLDEVEV